MKNILSSAIAFIALFTVTTAIAQNPHFNKKDPPSVNDQGTTLCTSGTFYGLGNYAGRNVQVQLFATGIVSTECSNPAGNVAPGQNSTTTLSSDPATIPVSKNGSAPFSLCTKEPNVTTQSAGCPNSKWTGRATDVEFTSAYILLNGERFDLNLQQISSLKLYLQQNNNVKR